MVGTVVAVAVAVGEDVILALEPAKRGRCGVEAQISQAMSLESRPRAVFECGLPFLEFWRQVCCSMIVVCVDYAV